MRDFVPPVKPEKCTNPDDPASLLPFSKDIEPNEWGRSIEGPTYNNPYYGNN